MALLYIPQLNASEVAVFARYCTTSAAYSSLPVDDKLQIEAIVNAAERYASGQTGLPCIRDAETGTVSAPNDDLKYAVLTVASEMLDNRQVSEQYTARNPTVMDILAMHSTNYLPGVDV